MNNYGFNDNPVETLYAYNPESGNVREIAQKAEDWRNISIESFLSLIKFFILAEKQKKQARNYGEVMEQLKEQGSLEIWNPTEIWDLIYKVPRFIKKTDHFIPRMMMNFITILNKEC